MQIDFQNADVCPAMRLAFKNFSTGNAEEQKYATLAATHLDTACGILKRGYALGTLNEHDYDEFMCHLEEAEMHLEELGVLEDHEYIREDLEPRGTEIFDIDAIDVEDEANEVEREDNWLFGTDTSDFED